MQFMQIREPTASKSRFSENEIKFEHLNFNKGFLILTKLAKIG